MGSYLRMFGFAILVWVLSTALALLFTHHDNPSAGATLVIEKTLQWSLAIGLGSVLAAFVLSRLINANKTGIGVLSFVILWLSSGIWLGILGYEELQLPKGLGAIIGPISLIGGIIASMVYDHRRDRLTWIE